MIPRIQFLVCLLFLLVAADPLAAEKGRGQLESKNYPVSEESRSGKEPTGQEDPVLGKAGDYLVKQSDVDRMLAYYPPETQSRLRKNPAEKQTQVRRMLEVKIIAHAAGKEKFDQIPLASGENRDGMVDKIGYCLCGQVLFADLVGGNLMFIVPEEIRGVFL